jgi:hypothetical protein
MSSLQTDAGEKLAFRQAERLSIIPKQEEVPVAATSLQGTEDAESGGRESESDVLPLDDPPPVRHPRWLAQRRRGSPSSALGAIPS